MVLLWITVTITAITFAYMSALKTATLILLIAAAVLSVVGIRSLQKVVRSLKWWRLRQQTLTRRYAAVQDPDRVLVRIVRAWRRVSDCGDTFLMERFARRFRIVRKFAESERRESLPSFAQYLERT